MYAKGSKVREIYSGRKARVVRVVTFVTPWDIHTFYVIEYADGGCRNAIHSDGLERVA